MHLARSESGFIFPLLSLLSLFLCHLSSSSSSSSSSFLFFLSLSTRLVFITIIMAPITVKKICCSKFTTSTMITGDVEASFTASAKKRTMKITTRRRNSEMRGVDQRGPLHVAANQLNGLDEPFDDLLATLDASIQDVRIILTHVHSRCWLRRWPHLRGYRAQVPQHPGHDCRPEPGPYRRLEL